MVETVAACDRLVRLLDDQAAVGAADVASIQSLTEEETDAVIRGIEVVPGFVAAFEREVPPAEHGLLEPPPPPPGLAPPRRPVQLRIGEEVYAVTGFAPQQLILSGRTPQAEGSLLEVELVEERPSRFHARVLLCWEEPGRVGLVLMPFALGGPALLRWQSLGEVAQG
jgi:hypothetical protein